MDQHRNYLTFKSHRIAYYRTGKGPLLTFIHGFPTASDDWKKVWPLLENEFDLLAIDLLGYGHSDKPRPHNYSIFEQADLIETVWKDLNVNATRLIAHDYGCTVALELIHRHKKRELNTLINDLLLLNGGIVPGAYRPRVIQRLLASRLGPWLGVFLGRNSLARNFRAIFGPDYQLTEAEIDGFWSSINQQNGKWALPYLGRYLHERKQHAQRWQESLAAPGVPLYFFWGLFDPISGRAVYEGMRSLNPAATGTALETVGHYPQWEQPEQLASLIRSSGTKKK